VREFTVRFQEQAWPGDVITYQATVAAQRATEDGPALEVELLATRQSGAAHLTGRALIVPARS
jgi:hypothetical protein